VLCPEGLVGALPALRGSPRIARLATLANLDLELPVFNRHSLRHVKKQLLERETKQEGNARLTARRAFSSSGASCASFSSCATSTAASTAAS